MTGLTDEPAKSMLTARVSVIDRSELTVNLAVEVDRYVIQSIGENLHSLMTLVHEELARQGMPETSITSLTIQWDAP